MNKVGIGDSVLYLKKLGLKLTYKFDMHYSQGDLILDIYYDSDDPEPRELRKQIRFSKTRHFFKSPFPGYSFFSCPDDKDISLLNSIVEYGKSELLEEDVKLLGSSGYKHYRQEVPINYRTVSMVSMTSLTTMLAMLPSLIYRPKDRAAKSFERLN